MEFATDAIIKFLVGICKIMYGSEDKSLKIAYLLFSH